MNFLRVCLYCLIGAAATPVALAQFSQQSLSSTPPTSASSPVILNVGQNYTEALKFTITFGQLGVSITSIEMRGTIPPGLSAGGTQQGDAVVVSARPDVTFFGTPTTPGDYVVSVNAITSTGLNSISQVSPWEVHFRVVGSAGAVPVFTGQPQSQTVSAGATVTFTAAATGDPAPAFQWFKDGAEIAGATSASLTLTNVAAANAGSYTVVATNSAGSATSAAATLTVTVGSTAAPIITVQPSSVTVAGGGTVALAVSASGTPAPALQWFRGDTAISGATNPELILRNVSASDAGDYKVVATSSAGVATSSSATVALQSNAASQLANLSVRTTLATSQTLIVGFATTAPKNVLVRAVGPTLVHFGIPIGFNPDPRIELYDTAGLVQQNDDWPADVGPAFAPVGAFALDAGSKDAALQNVLSGGHTAHIKSNGNGIVLVEVYDAGTGSARLVNVSARNRVGTGDDILIAGFVITGDAAKTVLIRAVGPSLAAFDVGDPLADPLLRVYNSANAAVAENDNWSSAAGQVFSSVGAFDLAAGTRDAALLITLPAGLYTTHVSGVGNATGEALVEVYEVP